MIAGNLFNGSEDQEWKGGFAGIDLLCLAGAGAGTYNVELFLKQRPTRGTVSSTTAEQITSLLSPHLNHRKDSC
jgi:hypothetical protein